jgi:hypothetical protein
MLLLSAWFLAIYGCKKGSSNHSAPTNATAILGKWLITKDQLRIYSVSGNLLIDTSLHVIENWFQTYNKDRSSITLNNTDTVGIFTYTIAGAILTTYDNSEHNEFESQNVLLLNGTNMELESILTTSNPPSNWGLDPTGTYKFVEDDYFTKQ